MEKIQKKYLDEAMRWVAATKTEHLEDAVSETMAESIESRMFVAKCSELLKALSDGAYSVRSHEALVGGVIATAFQIGRRYGNEEVLRGVN